MLNLFQSIRKLHVYRSRNPIDESLRGWNSFTPPLKPRAFLDLGVSDIAYRFCSTKRDIWLKKRMGVVVEPNEAMKRGLLVHNIFHYTSREVAKYILMDYDPWDAYELSYRRCIKVVCRDHRDAMCARLCREFSFIWSSLAMEMNEPIAVTEFVVDGTPLGLSRHLRVDALFQGSIVIELKYGVYRHDYAVALAGYALAMESYLEIPIDFGVIMMVNGDGTKIRIEPIYIDDSLRQEFVSSRDEVIDILLSDVEPPKSSSCPQTCPYRKFCV